MKINIFGSEGLIKKIFDKHAVETPEQLLNKSMDLFKNGNSKEAYVYLQAAATKGHAEAAFQMGSAIMEKKTFGSKEDAFKYFTIASEKDHAFATTNLATCYQLGEGTQIDNVKAIHLLNKAIKLGDEMASFNLAQTYLLGVGVQQDEIKGWNMLNSLAKKGNENARAYINDLIKQGYNPPIECGETQSNIQKDIHRKSQMYMNDYAPECELTEPKIIDLYNSARSGNESAKEELMELGGNQMNRDAMNALRKLGLIVQEINEDFKRGTIEYIAKAWKTFNVDPLYVVCAWTYPGFSYIEYKGKTVLYETNLETNFIERIADEMNNCRKKSIIPKFRLREVENSSGFCVDVLIPNTSLSSFYLNIDDGHFLGIYRVFDDTKV